MKAIVNINGLIGTWEGERGVELIDVVSQIKAQQGFTEVEVRIGSSEGGTVTAGLDIYNYLKGLSVPITTIIENFCASISSVVFLAGDTRIMRPNARLLIHNPWGAPVGNADALDEYSKELRSIEKQFSEIYNAQTGIGKDALTAMMRNETTMTAGDALQLGFATAILEPLKIAAYLSINSKIMSKQKKTLKEQLKDVMAKLKGDEPVALTLQDGTGQEIVFDTENEVPAIGDVATIEGAPADGSFVMPSGETFVFVAGTLTEIIEATTDEELVATIRKIVSDEIAAAMKDANETAKVATDAILNLTKKYEVLAKSVKSTFKQEPVQGSKKLGASDVDEIYSKFRPQEGTK